VPPKCIVCGATPTDRDHIRSRGAGGTDDDWNIWHVCRFHHQQKHSMSLTLFVKHYGLQDVLIKKGWEFDSLIKKWRHIDST
jgi:hypothetical protein